MSVCIDDAVAWIGTCDRASRWKRKIPRKLLPPPPAIAPFVPLTTPLGRRACSLIVRATPTVRSFASRLHRIVSHARSHHLAGGGPASQRALRFVYPRARPTTRRRAGPRVPLDLSKVRRPPHTSAHAHRACTLLPLGGGDIRSLPPGREEWMMSPASRLDRGDS